MVPQPLPYTAPTPAALVFDPSASIPSEVPVPALPYLRNTSGRPWKLAHGATVRSQKSLQDKSSSNWDKRQLGRAKDDSVKKIEREMKEEKLTAEERKRNINKERKLKEAEKLRLEEMATRMSARKLQRMKKRMGRTKKINA